MAGYNSEDVVGASKEKRPKVAIQVPTMELVPGLKMPLLGYGVGTAWFKGARGEELTIASIHSALDHGLLHVDEAEMYRNEAVTGKALKAWFQKTGRPRSDIFITGKVLGSIDGLPDWQESLEASCRNSIELLGIEHFDLFLIHAPFHQGKSHNPPFKRSLPDVWKEMETLVAKGLAKAIGVSNWRIRDIEAIYGTAVIKPCINQIENHPHLRQPALIDYCESKGIAIASYGGLKPLTSKDLAQKRLMTEVVPRIAAANGKSLAQVLQRWNHQSGPVGRKVVITTTQQAARIQEYLEVFDASWQLSDAEMAEINAAGDENVFRAFWNEKLDDYSCL